MISVSPLFYSDLEGFKLLMRIFTKSEIDQVRRSIYHTSRQVMGRDHEFAVSVSHSADIITLLLRMMHPPAKKTPFPRHKTQYRNWVNAVKFRDDFTCRMCGSRCNLHVHHIKPVRDYPELSTEFDNGVTLCGSCHMRVHHLFSHEETEYFLKRGVRV